MDAVKFLNVSMLMCNENISKCKNCLLHGNNNGHNIGCLTLAKEYPEEVVRIVEKYWEANRPKTNAEWVKEELEKTGYSVNIEVLKEKCPVTRSVFYAKLLDKCPRDKDCTECRAWWNEPYEEKNGDIFNNNSNNTCVNSDNPSNTKCD